MDKCNLAKAIGWRIKQARNALGMFQKDFCSHIDMPLPSLRDYELGKRIPGGEAITSFMSAGISADWLLSGEGSMLRECAKAPSNDQQIGTGLIDSGLFGEIAFKFEVALKAQEGDETGAWILAQSAFPGLTSEDERPSEEEFEAFFESCGQRLKITHLIGNAYNNVIKIQDESEREQTITNQAFASSMFLKNPQIVENIRNQFEELKAKILKGEATPDEEKWFFSVNNSPE